MGWLDLIVDVGIIAGQVSTANAMSALQKQGAELAQVEAVLNQMRNSVFKFREAAEEVLLIEEEEQPKRVAAAMELLETWYRGSGLTPDLFFGLYDKEYTASTSRFLRSNSRRLRLRLPADELREVDKIVNLALDGHDAQSRNEVQRFFGNHSLFKSLSAQPPAASPTASSASTVQPVSAKPTVSQTVAPANKSPINANLIVCPRCGENVSSRELYCPHCSARMPR